MTHDPVAALAAISLLAYLGADDDGSVPIDHEPDEARQRTRLACRDLAAQANAGLDDVASRPEAEAAWLVSGAMALLAQAGEVALDGPHPEVAAARAEVIEAAHGLLERLWCRMTGAASPAVTDVLRSSESEAIDLSSVLEVADEQIVRQEIAKMEPVQAVPVQVEPAAPVLADFAWPEPPPLLAAMPSAGSGPGPLPVGTIAVTCTTVYARRVGGWDLAGNAAGTTYHPTPSPIFDPAEGEVRQVIALGDGTEPPSWVGSNAAVMEVADAWFAAHPEPVLPSDDEILF